ncbi:uncharacterized protein STEHIDRAFT_46841 [Stereum hirsutum FP-91666 SS1]|uniref:uncharacterized protein n=1 Tax=Stereum hirsutum (strain FP-91666) TaxID=721885 RepID=UPI000440E07A|nr:uncharacterized protein STEHIDRAFT_46841 [Stereum hirsutum FP-91666 SS1]EIM92246.1 hypothetical protein STEHIDRAFT_46841 [Stereum hirsutum FP-91666 SS1]
MAAISLAKQAAAALSREKPRSSITEWVDILTSPGYEDEVYDGIPELIDSINLQAATGSSEASRALRKKLKHGNAHNQYRALVILKALVENCGTKFQTTFADGHFTDAIKQLSTDPSTDPKVRKKLIAVLASWHNQFKDDRSMTIVAGLYRQCRPDDSAKRQSQLNHQAALERESEHERKRKEEKAAKEDAKRKARMEKEAEKERIRKAEEDRKRSKNKPKRKPFNFEEEKPAVLTAIANASSAANNLVNAITLVNTEHDSLQSNERVQECLTKTKQARKQIVRYIQLVEDEEFIGTLIETNERIIAAMQSYDTLSNPAVTEKDVAEVQEGLAAANINDSEVLKLQEKQRAAVMRAMKRGREKDSETDEVPAPHLHPDLQDLSFGTLGADQRNLPPPIRPNAHSSDDEDYRRGTLSDYSDYESSDEDTHNQRAGPSSGGRRDYGDDSDSGQDAHKAVKNADEDDPFADPFAD